MNVLLTNYLYRPNVGGVENSLHFISKELIQLGHHPIILASDLNQFNRQVRLPSYEKMDGIDVYRIPCLPSDFPLRAVLNPVYLILKGYKRIKSLNRKYHFDFVISRDYRLFISVWLAVYKIKNFYIVPAIFKNQDIKFSNSDNLLKRLFHKLFVYSQHERLQRFSIRKASVTYVFSKAMYNQVNSIAKGNLKIINPGIDTILFRPVDDTVKKKLRNKLNLPKNDKLILFLGRVTKVKGLDIAIEAFKKLNNNDLKLVIVGDGSDKNKLQKRAIKENIQNIIFRDSTKTPVLYYQACDAFLMSSLYEPFGQTILEASACNLPVIAFEGKNVHTASKEIMGNKAYYCKPEPENLAKLINYLFMQNSNIISSGDLTSIRAGIVEEYSWNKFINSILKEVDII